MSSQKVSFSTSPLRVPPHRLLGKVPPPPLHSPSAAHLPTVQKKGCLPLQSSHLVPPPWLCPPASHLQTCPGKGQAQVSIPPNMETWGGHRPSSPTHFLMLHLNLRSLSFGKPVAQQVSSQVERPPSLFQATLPQLSLHYSQLQDLGRNSGQQENAHPTFAYIISVHFSIMDARKQRFCSSREGMVAEH